MSRKTNVGHDKHFIDLTDDIVPESSPNDPIIVDGSDSDPEQDEELKLAIALSLSEEQHDTQITANAPLEAEPGATAAIYKDSQPHPAAPLFLGLDRKQMEADRLARLKRKRGDTDTGVVREKTVSPPPLRRGAPLSHAASGTLDSVNTSTNITRNTGTASNGLPAGANKKIQVLPKQNPQLPYPSGTSFQTPSPDDNATSKIPSLSFASIIAPSPSESLQSVLMSSYIWDFDWLLPHFSTKKTKFLLVMHAKYAEHRAQLQSDFESIPNVRLCFPPMEGQVNCMHSKLIILFYSDDDSTKDSNDTGNGRCRIVVPTANLVGFDWGVGGVMENSGWCIDLPLLKNTHLTPADKEKATTDTTEETLFKTSLFTFLRAQHIPEDILRKLSHYSFAATAPIGFVHSIGGSHGHVALPTSKVTSPDINTPPWRLTGHPQLGTTLTALGLATPTSQPLDLDFVTSSLGALNPEFMRCIYLASHGDDGLSEYTLRTAKTLPATRARFHTGSPTTDTPSQKQKKPIDPFAAARQRTSQHLSSSSFHSSLSTTSNSTTICPNTGASWQHNFRIYFPSRATVDASRGGPEAAGTICFAEKWWANPQFPRASMRDCVSVRCRGGMLMHNKILFARFQHPRVISGDDRDAISTRPCIGWTYIGSGNLSESAWGRLVQDKTTKAPKLNCRNWECGVVIPVFGDAGAPAPAAMMKTERLGSSSVMLDDQAVKIDQGDHGIGLAAFAATVPIPMQAPGERYNGDAVGAGAGANKIPWFFGGGFRE